MRRGGMLSSGSGSGTMEKSCCHKRLGGGIFTSKQNSNCFVRSEITARNAECCTKASDNLLPES